ncbi:hypothetical protein PVAND_017621 [Polypedilum vanderplanki]|uniref:DNA-directed DNA polymerase n=1 Tax=Polypedilum vanderplanki TaxID=319348 RepID=A0A9J6B9G7_POLVA|nr:hypothetical protein PVAND_017621 [Polypedilum vanderplanki]
MNFCKYCNKLFASASNLKRHNIICEKRYEQKALKNVNKTFVLCKHCNAFYYSSNYYSHIKSNIHRNALYQKYCDQIDYCEIAYKNIMHVYRLPNVDEIYDPEEFLLSKTENICDILTKELAEKQYIKYALTLCGDYCKFTGDNQGCDKEINFVTRYRQLTLSDTISEGLESDFENLLDQSQNFYIESSGWSLKGIKYLLIESIKIEPFLYNSGGTFLATPPELKTKNALLNIKSTNNLCFLYAIIAYFLSSSFPKKERTNAANYDSYIKYFIVENLQFPLPIDQINVFISMNKCLDISINVYSYFNKKFGILKLAQHEKRNHINLLLLQKHNYTYHYVLIKNLSRLLNSVVGRGKRKLFFCKTCLSSFKKIADLNLHYEIGCGRSKLIFPKQNFLKFKHYESRMKKKFLFFGDLETIAIPLHTCEPDPKKSFTHKTHLHTCFAFAYYVYSLKKDNYFDRMRIFNGPSCLTKGILSIEKDIRRIYYKHFRVKYERTKVTQDVIDYLMNRDKICSICNQPLLYDREDIHLDHDSTLKPYECYDEKFPFLYNIRSFKHASCNQHYIDRPTVYHIFFHSSSSLDNHCLILELAKLNRQIDVISKSSENYIAITWKFKINEKRSAKVKILDSYRFLTSSLQTLVENTQDFTFVETYLKNEYGDKLEINKNLFRKQFLPYSYLSYETLQETQFPNKDSFFNELKNENLTQENYNYAKKIYLNLKCKNLLEYTLYYLKLDVLLLTEVFIQFRNLIFHHYSLDVANYVTLSSFGLDCSLAYTGEKVELINDINQYLFIKKGIRGGNCFGNFVYKSSNSRWSKNYDSNKPEIQLNSTDFNSLYGFMMGLSLPHNGYRWCTQNEISQLSKNFIEMSERPDGISYFVEITISYPRNIHDDMSLYPLFPVLRKMKDGNTSKLIGDLYTKNNYVVHIKFAAFAIKMGLKLEKIHRALQFNESPWLKPFVDLNTNLRAEASLAKLYSLSLKLLSNSCYGKFLENKEKQQSYKLCVIDPNCKKSIRKMIKAISSPYLKNFKVFNDFLVGFSSYKKQVILNRPTPCGAAILDFSKMAMADMYYNKIKKVSKEKVELCYTDCDSLLLAYYGDFFQFIKENYHLFDTSSFSPSNPFQIEQKNMRISGKMKEECGDRLIKNFVFLRPKTYLIVFEDEDDNKNNIKSKAKGVSSATIKQLTYKDYIDAMKGNTIQKKMQQLRSQNHQVYTISINKIALRAGCTKRYFFPSGDSLPFGHYKLEEMGIEPPFIIE